jgi:hypothetical protein
MQPEGSLSCFQELTSDLYRDLDEFSPHSRNLFILRSILISSSHVRLDVPSSHYAVFSILLLLHLSSVQICCSAPCYQTHPNLCVVIAFATADL